MKHVNLLLSAREEETLSEFASTMFECLKISTFEERESENYVDGHYFIGMGTDAEFKLMKSDATEHVDLPFWIRISAAIRGDEISLEFVEHLANEVIKPCGREVARVDNFGRVDEHRINY